MVRVSALWVGLTPFLKSQSFTVSLPAQVLFRKIWEGLSNFSTFDKLFKICFLGWENPALIDF